MGLIQAPLNFESADLAVRQDFYKTVIKNKLSQQSLSLINSFTQMHSMVWHNKYLTPQEMMDALGTDAHQLFQVAAAVKTLVNTFSPGAITLGPEKTLVFNDDGTVTIGA